MEKFLTNSAEKTKKIAATFAEQMLRQQPKNSAMVLGLQGDLGTGKTTFLQGFAKGLGVEEKILSPTFIVMKKFQIPNHQFSHFYHIDCYRLHGAKEILDLGFKEIISNPKNIVAVEWPEKISKILPKNILKITFSHLQENKREIIIDNLEINITMKIVS